VRLNQSFVASEAHRHSCGRRAATRVTEETLLHAPSSTRPVRVLVAGAICGFLTLACSDAHECPSRRIVGEESDAGCDGTPDTECRTWAYDAMGRWSSSEIDAPCDGMSDACVVRTYDANGSLTSSARDIDCDGTDDSECFEWSCDANGVAVSGRYSPFFDNSLDSCDLRTYDSRDRMTAAIATKTAMRRQTYSASYGSMRTVINSPPRDTMTTATECLIGSVACSHTMTVAAKAPRVSMCAATELRTRIAKPGPTISSIAS
jgi:hypothetical protein